MNSISRMETNEYSEYIVRQNEKLNINKLARLIGISYLILVTIPLVWADALLLFLSRLGISPEQVFNFLSNAAVLQVVQIVISSVMFLFPFLIVMFGTNKKLGEIISTGTIVNAEPSKEIIGNIFFHNAPLHDGATIIRGGRVYAAGCFLPLSQNYDISNMLGTRHRAALGISENSDAVAVVVSEETGKISMAVEGELMRKIDPVYLKRKLEEYMIPEKNEAVVNKIFGKGGTEEK